MDKLSLAKAQNRSLNREEPKVALDYEAVQSSTNRKQHTSAKQRPQDIIFTAPKRAKAENATKDVLDNIPLAGWMIRRHLDAVSRFYVDVDSSVDKGLRNNIEGLFKWAGKPEQFDASKRHSIDEAWRLYELNKVMHGDSLMAKISRRSSPRYGSVQLIEGSRIYTPRDLPDYLAKVGKDGFKRVNDHGIELDEYGGTKSFVICKSPAHGTQLLFDKRVMAKDAIYSGYFTRYSQTRGESPLLCAINQLLDIKEGMEYILLKIKLHALFGYAITKEAVDEIGDGLGSSAGTVVDEDPEYTEDSEVDTSREINISNGPFGMNLMEGEKVQTIESETPPESVKDYTELAIRSALLALDIPFSFFDAGGSNFAKVIADRKMYEISAESKRIKNQQAYEQWVDWKLSIFTSDGGPLSDYSYQELRDHISVRPHPTPWLDKESEIAAEERAIALGIKSIPDLARERGVDPFEVIDKQAEFLRYAESKNVPIYIGDPGARSERDNVIDNEIREGEYEDDDETE